MHSSFNIPKKTRLQKFAVFWLHVQNSNSARMYETLCVSVSILRGKILIKTDFLRYKFGLTVTVSLVRSRGLGNQIELI